MKHKIGINSTADFIRSPTAQKHNYYQILHDFKTKICYSTSQCEWVVYSESHTLGFFEHLDIF